MFKYNFPRYRTSVRRKKVVLKNQHTAWQYLDFSIFFFHRRLKKLPDPRPSRNIRFCASQKLSAKQKSKLQIIFIYIKNPGLVFC